MENQNDCPWCNDLNSEPNKINVSEIYIYGAGYYNFGIPIICCPVCGTRLKRYTKTED